jgi:hypothetical protein
MSVALAEPQTVLSADTPAPPSKRNAHDAFHARGGMTFHTAPDFTVYAAKEKIFNPET